MIFNTSKHAPIDQKTLLNTTERARCFDGKNSLYNVTDCGAPPIPNPTSPLNKSIQINAGENDDKKPAVNVINVHIRRH